MPRDELVVLADRLDRLASQDERAKAGGAGPVDSDREARRAVAAVLARLPHDERRVRLPELRVVTIALPTLRRDAVDCFGVLEAGLAQRPDILVAPEWLFMPSRDHVAFRATVRRLRDMSRGSATLVVPGTMALVDRRDRYLNVAFAIADGRVLKSYAKRSEGLDHALARELTGDSDARVAWHPGRRDGGFSWSGHHVALEICADHRHGRARLASVLGDQPPVALQLVPSFGLDGHRDHSVACARGGLLVMADNRGGYVGIREPATHDQPLISRQRGTTRAVGVATLMTVDVAPT